MNNIKGEFFRDGENIRGWVRGSVPEPLWVELLCDGVSLAAARADLSEPRGCGFWFPLPSIVLDEGAVIEVRVANTSICLDEAIVIDKEEKNSLLGEIFVDRGLTVSGWAADPLEPDISLSIFAWEKDEEIAKTVAAMPVFNPPEADGHGFVLHLPPELADGKEHILHVRDSKKRELPGSPLRIRCVPQNASTWLAGKKNLTPAEISLLRDILESAENRIPGLADVGGMNNWLGTFPVPRPARKQKIALVSAISETPTTAAILKKQQFVELRAVGGQWDCMLLLPPGADLHPYALAHMYEALKEQDGGLVYADALTVKGEPLLKPAWDPYAFAGQDYLGAVLVSRKVVENTPRESAGWRFRLAIAAQENGGILHLPQILGVEAGGPPENREQAAREWLEQQARGSWLEKAGNIQHVHINPSRKPRVSIIIPTRDHADLLGRCLASLEATAWPDIEIVIVDNDSRQEDALALLKKYAVRPNVVILPQPGPFNYALINNEAAKRASGEFLCFLNNDTEALAPDWLSELMGPMLLPGVGCVGAKLLWPTGLVQHAGVVVGVHQLAANIGNRWLDADAGYMNRNQILQQYSAVTAACFVTPRKLFLDLGGFDGYNFPIAFNDVDYCLRLRAVGKKVLWTPFSRLAHHESASRGRDETPAARARGEREMNLFRSRWGHYEDPFYNPNLPLSVAGMPFYGLAFPPRSRSARTAVAPTANQGAE